MDELFKSYRTSYLIYVLTVPTSSTLDDPSTPDGAQWWMALHSLGDVPGWSDAWWSRRTEDSSKVDLFMGWNTLTAAKAFSSPDLHDSFAWKIQPLLSHPIAIVYVTQFDTDIIGGVAAYPQGITTVHFAYFNSHVEKNLRQDYESSVRRYGEILYIAQDPHNPYIEEFSNEGFEGFATGWAQLIPVLTGHAQASAANGEPDPRPNTMFIILTSWRNAHAEEVLDQKMYGTTLLYDQYIQSVLNEADIGYNRHHLKLNLLTPGRSLGDGEWSSTILGRLPNAGYP